MVFVLFPCCAIAAGCPTGSRKTELVASGYAKGEDW